MTADIRGPFSIENIPNENGFFRGTVTLGDKVCHFDSEGLTATFTVKDTSGQAILFRYHINPHIGQFSSIIENVMELVASKKIDDKTAAVIFAALEETFDHIYGYKEITTQLSASRRQFDMAIKTFGELALSKAGIVSEKAKPADTSVSTVQEKKPIRSRTKKPTFLQAIAFGAAAGFAGGSGVGAANALFVENPAAKAKIDTLSESLEAHMIPGYYEEEGQKIVDESKANMTKFSRTSQAVGAGLGLLAGLGYATKRRLEKDNDSEPKKGA